MTLEQLRYFIEADKFHSFTKAAEALYLSQSNISAAISNLEKELGVQLFQRSKKGVSLTKHGEEIIQHAWEIMNHITAIQEYVKEPEQILLSEVRIGSTALFSRSVMKEILLKTYQVLPDTNVKIDSLDRKQIIDDIYYKKIQLGLLGYRDSQQDEIISELQKKDISYTIIHKSALYLYANCEHPLAGKQDVTLNDISSFPLVAYEDACADLIEFLKEKRHNITVTNDYEVLIWLAQQPSFLAIAPYINDDQFKEAGLCKISQSFFKDNVNYMYIRSDDIAGTYIDKIFHDILGEFFVL